jgi:hypothetical protein
VTTTFMNILVLEKIADIMFVIRITDSLYMGRKIMCILYLIRMTGHHVKGEDYGTSCSSDDNMTSCDCLRSQGIIWLRTITGHHGVGYDRTTSSGEDDRRTSCGWGDNQMIINGREMTVGFTII